MPGRIDHAVRDSEQDFMNLVRDKVEAALRVAPTVDPRIVREKANNLTQVLFACFEIRALPAEPAPVMPKTDEDWQDERICTNGGK